MKRSILTLIISLGLAKLSFGQFDKYAYDSIVPAPTSITVERDYSSEPIEEYEFKLQVSPNPASDWLTIHTPMHSNVSIEIYNVFGNLVLQESSKDDRKLIHVSDFKNGVYFVRANKQGDDPITRKIIIHH